MMMTSNDWTFCKSQSYNEFFVFINAVLVFKHCYFLLEMFSQSESWNAYDHTIHLGLGLIAAPRDDRTDPGTATYAFQYGYISSFLHT